MKIRRANKNDIEVLATLLDSFDKEVVRFSPKSFSLKRSPGFQDNLERLARSMLRNRKSVVLVAEENGECVGFVHGGFYLRKSFLYPKQKMMSVHDLFVLRKFREKGVATLLLEALRKRSKAKKYDLLEIGVSPNNLAAKNLYRKFGFKVRTERLWLKL